MAVFAISDLHLSLSVNKPMDVFAGWSDYVARLEKNWKSIVTDSDTVVIPGDITWGMTLADARADFAFLDSLPGTKLIGKGNHDYWWSTKSKADAFFLENGFSTLRVLFNNAYAVDGIAVCGTRGWFYDAQGEEDEKVLLREVGRLERSIGEAEKTGLEPVVFLHYPPLFGDSVCEEIMEVLRRHGIRRVYYGHIHGPGAKRAVIGTVEGMEFRLLACDHTGFCPVLVEKPESE